MPLRKKVEDLSYICANVTFKNLLKLVNNIEFGRRVIEDEETEQDKYTLDYVSKIPNRVLRRFINPLIEAGQKQYETIYAFLKIGQPEHVTLPVHGEDFGDLFFFVYKNGKCIESVKLMTVSGAPMPSKHIKRILHSFEKLEILEFDCFEPFVRYCPFLFEDFGDTIVMPQVTALRFLKVSANVDSKELNSFIESIIIFLQKHPNIKWFTFEYDYPLLEELVLNDVKMNSVIKLELPFIIANSTVISNIRNVFPNVKKLKIGAASEPCSDFIKLSSLKSLHIEASMKSNKSECQDDGNESDVMDSQDVTSGDYQDSKACSSSSTDQNSNSQDSEELDSNTSGDSSSDESDEYNPNEESYSSFTATLLPFFDSSANSLTSLHLNKFSDVSLDAINKYSPQLKCLKIIDCVLKKSDDETRGDGFKNLLKFHYDVSSACGAKQSFFYLTVIDPLSFRSLILQDDLFYVLKSCVNLEKLWLFPAISFGDSMLADLLQHNKLQNLNDLTLAKPSLTVQGLMTLLSIEADNLHNVQLSAPLKIFSTELRMISEFLKATNVNVNLVLS